MIKLVPTGTRIVVRAQEKTTNGLIGRSPHDSTQPAPHGEGIIVAVGEGYRGPEGKLQKVSLRAGAYVLFGLGYNTFEVLTGGEKLLVMEASNVFARLA